jgi:hypothetical protein
MVEVFKTNVKSTQQSIILLSKIRKFFPNQSVNFDLGDCDKILRVEGEEVLENKIVKILLSEGFLCEVLED